MPVLSLHNSNTAPTGSASYTLGLSIAPNLTTYSSYRNPSDVNDRLLSSNTAGITSGLNNLPSTINPFGICNAKIHRFINILFIIFVYVIAYSTFTNPLISTTLSSNVRKPYDDLDLIVGGRYGPRPLTPTSPLQTSNWGFETFNGLEGVNPTFIHVQRPHLSALDLESKI